MNGRTAKLLRKTTALAKTAPSGLVAGPRGGLVHTPGSARWAYQLQKKFWRSMPAPVRTSARLFFLEGCTK